MIKPLKWETSRKKASWETSVHYGFHEFGYYIVTKNGFYWHLSTFTNRGAQRNIASFSKLSDAKETAQFDYESCVHRQFVSNEGSVR